MGRLANIWSFVKTLKVEPYLFVHMFAGSVASVTTGLLKQDKICTNYYEQSSSFCMDLNEIKSSEDPDHYKDKVLAFSTQLGLYGTLLETIPSVIWSLFIGSFTDKLINGRKIVMCLSSIGNILQSIIYILNAYFFSSSPYFMLMTALPLIITGGSVGSFMAVYSYVSANTKEGLRSIRYAIIEFSFFFGGPLGTYIGGVLLKNTPNSSGGQLHNYITIIGIGLVFQIVAFILLLLLINEKKEPETDRQTLVTNEELDTNSNEVSTSYKDNAQQMITTEETQQKWYYPVKLLFDINNVKEVWICCLKLRPNKGRLQMWLMFMSMCTMLMAFIGGATIGFQYSEKVYFWSPSFYSTVSSVTSIVHSIAMTIAVPLLVIRWKLKDTELAIIGILSIIFRNLTVGSYQHPIGYYISAVVGAISGIISVAIRSKLSKLVKKDELGKVFSLLATLESITPLIASLIFTFLFEWSIGFFPGLVYEVCAAFLIIPLMAMIYIDLTIDSKDETEDTSVMT